MGVSNQYETNLEIERIVRGIMNDNRYGSLSQKDKDLIRQYSGAGGQASKGATGEGLLYEFYTPDWLADRMAKLAYAHGFKDGGRILEPSIATGELIRPFVGKGNKIMGFEINPISAQIARLLYPEVIVREGYFEEAFLEAPRFSKVAKLSDLWWTEDLFDLVIGNPPFGIYKNKYSAYFNKKLFKQIEVFFIYQSLQVLKPGGLLVFLQSSNFLSNGDKYQYAKEEIGKIADLIDAYRLPKVFATTDVPTDIMILRKK